MVGTIGNKAKELLFQSYRYTLSLREKVETASSEAVFLMARCHLHFIATRCFYHFYAAMTHSMSLPVNSAYSSSIFLTRSAMSRRKPAGSSTSTSGPYFNICIMSSRGSAYGTRSS